MKRAGFHGDNRYRLVLGDDGVGEPRIIEFEGSGAQAALVLTGRHCAGRTVEVFENGRSLGMLRANGDGGFWDIMPPAAKGV